MNTLLTLATFVVAFFMAIYAYEKGLKNGQNIVKGKDVQVTKNPVKTVVEAVETIKENKQTKALDQELTDIMSYSADTALEAIKKER